MAGGKRPPTLATRGPRFLAGRITTTGHSWNTIGAPPDRMFNTRLAQALGGTPVYNIGVGGSTLVNGEAGSSSSSGGWVTVAQRMRRAPNPGPANPTMAPQPGIFINTTGLNDVGKIALMSAGDKTTALACFKDVVRAQTAFEVSAIFYDAASASGSTNTVFSGAAGVGAGSWVVRNSVSTCSGAGYRDTAATGDQVTHTATIASKANGYRWLTMLFLCPGPTTSLAGSVITFTDETGAQIYPTGYPNGTPFDTSTVRPAYSGAAYATAYWKAARFKVLAGAGRKIIATSGAGGMAFDGVLYDPDYLPPVIWNAPAQTPASLLDADQTAVFPLMQADMKAVVAEFDSPFVRYVDIDAALAYGDPGSLYGYWLQTVDTTHCYEPGNAAIAAADYEAVATMPLTTAHSVTLGGGRDDAVVPAVDMVAVANITLSGASVCDGVTPVTGQRVLCIAQTNTINNGVWLVDTGYSWTRPLDFVGGLDVAGKAVKVRGAGGATIAGGSEYTLVSTAKVICDTTAQTGWTRTITPGGAATAATTTFTPAGGIAATNVQAAIEEVVTDVAAAYQPLDSDLTAIAALTTTAYGRSLLALADQAALTAANAAATTSLPGIVELATSAETQTGTDTARAVTAAGAAATYARWYEQVVPFGVASTSTGTWSETANASAIMAYYRTNSSAAVNDAITWPVWLSAGTWTFELLHHLGSNVGIYTVKIGGVSIGTIDGYAASPAWNSRGQIAGVAVASSGKTTVELVMATKNASSSAYASRFSLLSFLRTA